MEQSARLPLGGAVTGWASCRMRQATFFDGLAADRRTRIPVPLAIGRGNHIREDSSVSVSREPLDPVEVEILHGIACTTRLRALFDAARLAPDLREAVVAIDMMAAAALVSIRQLRSYTSARDGWRGVPQVRRALGLASEHSKSPNETRMRLIWQLDAGFPRPLVNQPVWDLNGRLLGIVDLLDPVAGVVGEFDGADHRTATRQSKDVNRETGLRDHGLEFFRVTGLDIPRRSLVVRRMRSTRGRALFLSARQRTWSVDPPRGWPPAESLDEFLEQRAWELALYAQYEREETAAFSQM